MTGTIQRIVVVTKPTRLEELIVRFQTRAQARFYLEQAGQPFDPIEQEHEHFRGALREVHGSLPSGIKQHTIDWRLISEYRFHEDDLVVTLGPDGLVVNVAKYLSGQPLIAVNPDPASIDGILLPTTVGEVRGKIRAVLANQAEVQSLSMAEAVLDDGQRLLALNDLFIGSRTHNSARYRIALGRRSEAQSSSGVIVSTGVGSTGWMRSVYEGAIRTAAGFGVELPAAPYRPLAWDDRTLTFAVREPFPSKQTGTDLVFGRLGPGEALIVESAMADNGVIFSDGVEADSMEFHSGRRAVIRTADNSTRLVV